MSSAATSTAKTAAAAGAPTNENEAEPLLLVDAGTNLLDSMYTGSYRGKSYHPPDLHTTVLPRAWSNHIDKIIVLAGTIDESKQALQLSNTDARLFSTVGVHPTRCSQEFGDTDDDDDSEQQQQQQQQKLQSAISTLREIALQGINDGTVVAVGECGLDYARTEFCDVDSQKRGLAAQLSLATELNLPLYLHNRETGNDLLDILKEHHHHQKEETKMRGVVHSFDDTIELAQSFIELGLYIGINGCSLKTAENLKVVESIPLEKILLETDCPWCDIRATHAGSKYVSTTFPVKKEKQYREDCCVKNRYEPCHVVQVAEVVAGVKGLSLEEVARVSRKNAYDLFGGLEKKKKGEDV